MLRHRGSNNNNNSPSAGMSSLRENRIRQFLHARDQDIPVLQAAFGRGAHGGADEVHGGCVRARDTVRPASRFPPPFPKLTAAAQEHPGGIAVQTGVRPQAAGVDGRLREQLPLGVLHQALVHHGRSVGRRSHAVSLRRGVCHSRSGQSRKQEDHGGVSLFPSSRVKEPVLPASLSLSSSSSSSSSRSEGIPWRTVASQCPRGPSATRA